MPTYITLYSWTEQGVKNLKEAPARIKASIKSAEAAGGKVLGVYLKANPLIPDQIWLDHLGGVVR